MSVWGDSSSPTIHQITASRFLTKQQRGADDVVRSWRQTRSIPEQHTPDHSSIMYGSSRLICGDTSDRSRRQLVDSHCPLPLLPSRCPSPTWKSQDGRKMSRTPDLHTVLYSDGWSSLQPSHSIFGMSRHVVRKFCQGGVLDHRAAVDD